MVLVFLHIFFRVTLFRIVVNSLGRIHNLHFFVSTAGLRIVPRTKKMLNKLGCLGSQCRTNPLMVPSLSSSPFDMRGLLWQVVVSLSRVRLGHCPWGLEPCRKMGCGTPLAQFSGTGDWASFACTRFTRQLGWSYDHGAERKYRPGMVLAGSRCGSGVCLAFCLGYVLGEARSQQHCLPTCVQKDSGNIFPLKL